MYLLHCVCLLILIMLINTESVTVMARMTTVIVTDRGSQVLTQHRLTDVTVRKGELTRLLCGRGQTRPRRTHLCSLSPPGRVDAACTARSWSPGKLALSLYRSNSESAEFREEELEKMFFYLQTIY